MASYTTNYQLTKPATDESVDITVLNDNFDTIDTKIKEAADAIPPVATTAVAGTVKPDGTTITVDADGTIHGSQTYQLPVASSNTLGGIKLGQNLSMGEDNKLNAYANIETDAIPTAGSTNVPISGGTYSMINTLGVQVGNLAGQVASIVSGIIWKTAVATFDDIATTYPTPSVGWTVTCLDTGYVYQYDGTAWVLILASLTTAATVAEVQEVLELGTGT
jgi:hypothetical protein